MVNFFRKNKIVIIGIMSDTHGDVKRTAKAIAALKQYKPDHVIHCGDIGSDAVLTELAAGFADPEVPVTCVLGNVDGYTDLFSPSAHVQVVGRFATLTIDGKKIAVAHGDDARRLIGAIQSGDYDYVFTGHTHERSDEHEGRTRVINPGALHRSREPGCAVLDLVTDQLTYLSII